MGFLDGLKFWKARQTAVAAGAASDVHAACFTEAQMTVKVDEVVEEILGGIAADLDEWEAENRRAAKLTESPHQRDKHMDRADEDAKIAARIRSVL